MYCQKLKYQSLDGCYLHEEDFSKLGVSSRTAMIAMLIQENLLWD
jgi:hypothetical protein